MQNLSPYIALGIVVISLLALIGIRFFYMREVAGWSDGSFVIVHVGDATIKVEVASSPHKKQQGLSGRVYLGKDEGMLFVFSKPVQRTFWMKDMQFPLDFVWIKDGRVIEVGKNIPVFTDGMITTIKPSEPAQMVLELNASTIERLKIQEGDRVSFSKR